MMAIYISSTAVRNGWSTLVRQVEYDGEQVVVTRCGQAVAALVSMADFERIRVRDEAGVKAARGWRRVLGFAALWKF